MKKYLLGILAIFFLASCVKEEGLPPGLRAGGFKLADDEKHAQVINEMSSQSIPFEIDERGWVNYMHKDIAKVLGIQRNVLYGNELSSTVWESWVMRNKAELELYTKSFEAENIPYRIDDHKGVTLIIWQQIYGPKVDHIIQEVRLELFERAFESIEKNHN